MLVDAHVHLFESGTDWKGEPASSKVLVAQMDTVGVDVAVVIPLPGVASNEFVQEQCRRFPGRLVGLYTPDFGRPDPAADADAFFCNNDSRGVKIHPRIQGVRVDDAAVRDLLGWAADRGLPVVFDVFPFGDRVDDPRLAPLTYMTAAREIHGLKLVLAHAGGHKVLDAFLVAKACPDVTLDISHTLAYYAGASPAADLVWTCRRLPPDRLAYGSDFPEQGLGTYLSRASSALAGLTPEAAAKVFGGTAARLFGIAGGG